MVLRFIEVDGGETNTKRFIYYAKNVMPIACFSRYDTNYISGSSYTFKTDMTTMVFRDCAYFSSDVFTGKHNKLIFVVFVQENQPTIERVVKLAAANRINVYNENGVFICSDTPNKNASTSPSNTNGPGELATEPIDGPGEML